MRRLQAQQSSAVHVKILLPALLLDCAATQAVVHPTPTSRRWDSAGIGVAKHLRPPKQAVSVKWALPQTSLRQHSIPTYSPSEKVVPELMQLRLQASQRLHLGPLE
mmetsp:Transcript_99667/g.197582  ORF Transcript_99667/g.197582 Transcript_99667/m.197582 type:complete len:106 (-) Transcript_99667:1287-1604(-)